MKRCPLCDFIYEDEQGVCDMDGIELVHEGGVLTHAAKDSTLRPPASAGPLRRRRSLHLLLGFGLVAAVFSAYYTSANRAAPPAPNVVEATPVTAATPLPTPAAETPASPSEEATPTPSPAAPATEPKPAGANGKRPRQGGGGKKKESKLSSILNKTGRMLKKPFGF